MKGGINKMFDLIVVIVPKHRDEEVLEAAKLAGATGGTILHGRSVRSSECKQRFGVTIQPEKEIVLMIVAKDKTEGIVDALTKELKFDKPHQGTILVLDAFDTIGVRS